MDFNLEALLQDSANGEADEKQHHSDPSKIKEMLGMKIIAQMKVAGVCHAAAGNGVFLLEA